VPRIPITQSAGDRDNIELPIKTGETFITGAAVYRDVNGDVNECGVNPASIYGFSNGVAGKYPVNSARGTFAKAMEDAKFWAQCSIDPVEATHSGNTYGITKDADGIWYVDFTKVAGSGNDRVYVHRVDVDTKKAEFSVLEAYRQVAP